MKKGVIVRHLLLPGAVKNAKAVVKYVYETYGDTVWLSLMSQYTPLPQVENISPLNRKTTKREYERLLDYTFSLGVTNAFYRKVRWPRRASFRSLTEEESDVIVHSCKKELRSSKKRWKRGFENASKTHLSMIRYG